MLGLEILLDLFVVVVFLVATYENQTKLATAEGEGGLNLTPFIEEEECSHPVEASIDKHLENPSYEDNGNPPWDVEEVVDQPLVIQPQEEELIPFDVNKPDVPNRSEVLTDNTQELSIDVTQITAKKAWKVAKALGLPYKNPDRSRIKVNTLRANIQAVLVEDPRRVQDVLPFVG